MKRVNEWHYFVNDIYFAEFESNEYNPYRVTINVKEKSDGHLYIVFSAENKKRLLPTDFTCRCKR